MTEPVAYDGVAPFYSLWVKTAPITQANLPFYVSAYCDSAEPVVELGVGNGRILIEAARRGRAVVGVDSSNGMLELCRREVAAANVSDNVQLVQADFRDFQLSEPAQLISCPFHSMGHMTTEADLSAAFEHVFGQLAPGGCFLFDHFVFSEEYAKARESQLFLRGKSRDGQGRKVFLWVASHYDLEEQVIDMTAYTDHVNANGVCEERVYQGLTMAWYAPDTVRRLLEAAGFLIEAQWGSFDKAEFGPESKDQVWCARKPEVSA